MENSFLSEFKKRKTGELSSGQKNRVSLAKALVNDPEILLLDEPTALLDPLSQKSILKIVKQLTSCTEHPITALWITHRLEELSCCDGAAIMENGQVGPWLSGEDLFQQFRIRHCNS